MKKIITNEDESVSKKRNLDFGPQKSTLDFLKTFARVYSPINTKQVKNTTLILN